jgi:O-antigen/teichoic acid export membrane protein
VGTIRTRPSAIFYVVGFAALALAIAGLVLSVQEESAGIATAATGIGAVGFLVCAWMLKRS